jgi:hypothetical protein
MKIFTALALLFLTACSPKSVDEYHTAESDEQIVRLLNGREYAKAIWEIESRNGKMPADKNSAFLLGQAYLGKAGLEPLDTAAKVSATQDFSSADGRALLPACAANALETFKNTDPLCILKRVYFNVPDSDSFEMMRAKALFRYAYPDPGSAPDWVNVVIGVVETASAVKRAGAIFLLAKHRADNKSASTEAELLVLAHQAKLLLIETDQALSRASHTGNKISQFLTGSSEAHWFDQRSDGVHWTETIGLAKLRDLLQENGVAPNDTEKFGPLLDKIRFYLDEQDKRITAKAG